MPSRLCRFSRIVIFSALGFPLLLSAQTPKAWFPFDNNVNDATGATGRTISGGTPVFTADRNGQINGAWSLNGSDDYIELKTATTNNSALDLGLKGNFTVMTWMNPTAPASGDNMLFGMDGSGTGTLHFGLRDDSGGKAHMGMWGNDLGADYIFPANNWYHLTYQWDGANQKIYINGLPAAERPATNTTRNANVRIGNAVALSSSFQGRLDDALIYDTALSEKQILNLVTTSNPLRVGLPGRPLNGNLGGDGLWGIREITGHGSITPDGIENAIAIAYNQAGGTIVNGTRSAINLTDPETAASAGNFPGDQSFVSDTGASDDDFVMIAQAFIQIDTESDYTFGFTGDDGSRLRIYGQDFVSALTTAGVNAIDPPNIGDQIFFSELGSNGTVLGVVHLTPGVYFLEQVYFEHTGGAYTEVYAATGAKTSFDSSFKLIGDPGGLAVVEPRPIINYYEASTTTVVNQSPSTITLSWDTLFDTSVSISGLPAVSGNSHTFTSPTSTTTYTLSATRGGEVVTSDITVVVDPPPTIVSFDADDATVGAGESVVLSWEVAGATSYVLNPGNTDVTANTTNGIGSITVNPVTTTEYSLTATGNGSTTSPAVTVNIGSLPVISSFTVENDDTSLASGAVVRLDWIASNFDSLVIDHGVGDVTSLSHTFVCPFGTTTYTLTATNAFGSSTAQMTLDALTAIGIDADGFTVRFVSSNGAIDSLADADALLGGAGIVSDVTNTNVSEINYVDSGTSGELTGDLSFPGGFVDNFALQATAVLVVNVAGTYTFGINNDDGARLRIDGNAIIVDDALHGVLTTTGSVKLTRGNHLIEYTYFEHTGGAAAEVFLAPEAGVAERLTVTGTLPDIVTANIIISEIMADNDKDVLVDGDGDASDWIELYNGTASPVDLGGWYLTDDAGQLAKWQFPANTLIPAGDYLIVWASDKALTSPPAGELHTNFKLSATGEYLALVGGDGTSIIDEISPAFPAQSQAVSWGRFDSELYTGYFVTPTPGARNVFGFQGLVGDTSFDVDRGFYTSPFSLTIASSTPGATILYTTDGSEPTNKNGTSGTVYTGPISIRETVVIRARAVIDGHYPSNIDTQTYIFVDDVVTQDAAHAHALGFPSSNVNGQIFEYDMNLEAAGNDAQRVKDALLAIPSISLVMEQDDLTEPLRGIYVNAESRGLERAGSIELLNEDGLGSGQFQENCGVRIRGGASRSDNNPKHAFRIFFRKTYGAGKLKYPLFQDEGTNEFDGIDLRTAQNYSWSFNNSATNTFLREVFGRDTQKDMGQIYTRSRYYHLYLNGHYWGLFMSQERAEADFAASYLGGSDTDYDTLKSAGGSDSYKTEVTDGTFDDWQLLWNLARASGSGPTTTDYFKAQGLAPDGLTPTADPVLLDVDNLADYLLVIFYTGSFDAPLSTFVGASNNWFGLRNRVTDDQGFQFFVHDCEHSMGSDEGNGSNTRSTDRSGPWSASIGTIGNFEKSNPQYLHEDLAHNAEYRLAFADRAHRALVAPGGALTEAEVLARIESRATTVDSVIDAEAARWGSPSLNKTTWQNAKADLLSWIDRGSNQEPANGPGRTELLLTQLRNYADGALYPALDAPVYTQNGSGTPIGSGNVPTGFQLAMTNPDAVGTIYFTTDGSDPRLPGGALNTSSASSYSTFLTLTQTTTVRSRVRNGAEWSALNEATFLVGALADSTNLVISKLYYNPPGSVEDDEYLEVMNIGTGVIELSGLTFTSGLTFDFSTAPDTTLNPGERAVVVKNQTAFETAYAALLPIHILGQYVGSLSNGGERIALLDATGGTIRDFRYDDSDPWPVTSDGDGAALVLIDPESNPDHGTGSNWRASTTLGGGTPGSDDRQPYAAWKTANGVSSDTEDLDGDGVTAFFEYAFGGSPTSADSDVLPSASVQTLTVGGTPAPYLTVTFLRNIGAENLNYSPEISADLAAWMNGPADIVQNGPPVHNGDGTETVVYRSADPLGSEPGLFIRVRLNLSI